MNRWSQIAITIYIASMIALGILLISGLFRVVQYLGESPAPSYSSPDLAAVAWTQHCKATASGWYRYEYGSWIWWDGEGYTYNPACFTQYRRDAVDIVSPRGVPMDDLVGAIHTHVTPGMVQHCFSRADVEDARRLEWVVDRIWIAAVQRPTAHVYRLADFHNTRPCGYGAPQAVSGDMIGIVKEVL